MTDEQMKVIRELVIEVDRLKAELARAEELLKYALDRHDYYSPLYGNKLDKYFAAKRQEKS